MMFYVYLIENKLSHKKYVGKANHCGTRWRAHRADSHKELPRTYIGRALRKHGVGNFTFTVLETCGTEDAAYEREKHWITAYASNQKGVGYNLESGGVGGKTASASTKAKLSALNTGKIVSSETRAKMSAVQLGRPRSPAQVAQVEKMIEMHRGKHFSPERRAALSLASKRIPKSLGHRMKIGDANRGQVRKPLTVEARLARSVAQKGKPKPHRNPRKSRLSVEDITSIRARAATGDTQSMLAKVYKMSPTTIGNVLHGRNRFCRL